MDRKAIMDVKVEFNGPVQRLSGENAQVIMIPFGGTVSGEIFSGIVEPCGVDTQVVNAAGVRHMSARYMLTGRDRDGSEARIYVENNGWFQGDDLPKPFVTVPAFYTDSAALAKYLHSSRFTGEGSMEDDGLHIRFYEIGR
ncbi:MAG: DUF3237 family protein [Oscillospiraceae bacterium]|nr:DUF3237 family protein [Oscillospiraceae bacterium]